MAFPTQQELQAAFQRLVPQLPQFQYGGPIARFEDGGEVSDEDAESAAAADAGLGNPMSDTPDTPGTGGEGSDGTESYDPTMDTDFSGADPNAAKGGTDYGDGGSDGTETPVERGREAAREAIEAGRTGRTIGVDEITGYVDLVPGVDRPTGTASELSDPNVSLMTPGARATSNAELAAAEGITGATPAGAPGQSSVVQGDVNADGKVDELDAIAAGATATVPGPSDYTKTQLPEQTLGQKAMGLAKAAADVNRDGVLDMKDVAITGIASALTGGIAGPVIGAATAYDNVQTAKQYNTYPGSEQTRMLAAQDEFAEDRTPVSSGGGGGGDIFQNQPVEPEVPECEPGYTYNPLTQACEYEGQAVVGPVAPIQPQYPQYAPPMIQYAQSPVFYPGTMVPQPQGGIMNLAPGTTVLGPQPMPQPMMGQIR